MDARRRYPSGNSTIPSRKKFTTKYRGFCVCRKTRANHSEGELIEVSFNVHYK